MIGVELADLGKKLCDICKDIYHVKKKEIDGKEYKICEKCYTLYKLELRIRALEGDPNKKTMLLDYFQEWVKK